MRVVIMLTKHSSSYYRQYQKQKAMKEVRVPTVRARFCLVGAGLRLPDL